MMLTIKQFFVKQDSPSQSINRKRKRQDDPINDNNKAKVEEAENGIELSSPQEVVQFFKHPVRLKKNSIYVCGLPEMFGEEDLSKFIIQKCQEMISFTPKITLCHVRSGEKDACVQFESNMTQIITALQDQEIERGKLIKVLKWKPLFSKIFVQYYNDEKAPNNGPKESGIPVLESVTSKTNNENSSDDIGEMICMKEQMKLLKEENEKLARTLNRVEEENAGLKARLHTTQQAREEAEIACSSWQDQFTEMKRENVQLNKNLYQAKQDLRSAREDRDQVQEAMQDLRVQSHKERGQEFVHIKKEMFVAKQKNTELKQSARALKEHIANIEANNQRIKQDPNDTTSKASSNEIKKEQAKLKKFPM